MLDSILELLGLRPKTRIAEPPDAVRQIVARLERLPPERARHVAAFARVLSRAAHADLVIGSEEHRRIERILVERAELSGDEAAAVTDIAVSESHVSGGTDHFLATRDFVGSSTRDQREELLECLFSVSAADGTISTAEENRVRQIATELGFSHREFAAARSRWNEHRAILLR